MPTYDYHCDACDHRFEEFQSITADPLRVCPSCRSRKLRRLISAGAGVLFRGSGFYETDYRSESYKKAAEADKKPAQADKKHAGEAGPKESSTDSAESGSSTASKPADKPVADAGSGSKKPASGATGRRRRRNAD